MKKIISIMLVALMLATCLTLGISAAQIDRNTVYQAAYGTPVVDGKMDEIYQLSDEMYAENGVFPASATVKEGQFATAKYRLVWNTTSLYIFCEVSDPTRSDPGAFNASATKMDNVDVYVLCDPEFSTEKEYADRSLENSGQFRYQPNCTIDEEPARAASWGGLTVINQLFNTLEYVGGYKSENGGDYYFEMKFDFNEAYREALKQNIAAKKDTLLGFAVQVNDVMDNDAKRDAMVFSNNATEGLSKNLGNCGVVTLYLQAGADVGETETTTTAPETTPAPAETTTQAPETTTQAPETTTPAAETTTPAETSAKPETTAADKSDKGGCGSSMGGFAVLATLMCACLPTLRRKNGK